MNNMKTATTRLTGADLVFTILNYAFLSLVLMIAAYPLWFVLIASFSDPHLVWGGKVWIVPQGFNLEGYRNIISNPNIAIGYRNSVLYTAVGTALNLFMTITAAYPLSRKDFGPRHGLTLLYTVTMFFSGGLIPTYLLVKSLGLINTFWAMILPNAVAFYYIVTTRTYFQTSIPEELWESASLEGCSNVRFLRSIVIPLSAPIIAVMTLFYSVGHWNSYFNGLIYLTQKNRFPLQLILREILILGQMQDTIITDVLEAATLQRISESIKYGVIIVASLPVLMLYPLVQRHFVKGIMIGALKG
jgi:putative aldouronate transport system permease protein